MEAISIVFCCVLCFTIIIFIKMLKETRKSKFEYDFELRNILLKQFLIGVFLSIIIGYFTVCFAFQK